MRQRQLEHLQTFLLAFRLGSLSEAAKLLGVSQSTASAHVHSLEQELGFALFERGPHGVQPTAKARALAVRVAPHLDALDDISAELSPSGADAVLHLGGAAEFLSLKVAPQLASIAEAAGADLRFRFGLADALLDELRAGSLDVVLSSVPPRLTGVAASPWLDEEFVLVASPRWALDPAPPGPDAAARALEGIPVLGYSDDLPIVRRFWRSVFGRRPSGLRTLAVLPDLRAIREAVLAGAGMSVLPRYLVENELSAGELVVLYEPAVAPLNTIYLAVREGSLERRPQLRAAVTALRRLVTL